MTWSAASSLADSCCAFVRPLTRSPGLDTRPAWSPDGRRIAFTSNRDGRYQIYVMNADGSGQRRVRDHPGRDDYATWHPDGQQLLVASKLAGKSDLYLLEVPVTSARLAPRMKAEG